MKFFKLAKFLNKSENNLISHKINHLMTYLSNWLLKPESTKKMSKCFLTYKTSLKNKLEEMSVYN